MASTPSYIWFAGPPKLYVAPFSETTGAEPAPASTIAYGVAPAGNWVDAGKTQGGITFQPSFENRDLETDQDDGPVGAFRHANGATLATPLLSGTLADIKRMLAMGTLTAGAVGTEDKLTVGGNGPFPDFVSILLEGLAPGSTAAVKKYRRLWIPKAMASEAPEMAHKKDEEIVLSVTWKAYIDEAQAAGSRLWSLFNDI